MGDAETPGSTPTLPDQPSQKDTVPEPATDSAPASSQGETQGTVTSTGKPPGQETQKKQPGSKRSGYRWSK